MALLVHLITRRPCAFLVPLVDGVKRNIEQCRNLISREGAFRLSAGYVGDDWVHMRDQCRWFGGMVGNHVADIAAKYGDTGEVPQALTDYIKVGRATTATSMAAQGTSTLLSYRTRSWTASACWAQLMITSPSSSS
jgi:hypothetical protein